MGWGIYGGGKYRGQGRPWGGGMRGVMGEFCGVRFMRVLWGRALWGGAVGQCYWAAVGQGAMGWRCGSVFWGGAMGQLWGAMGRCSGARQRALQVGEDYIRQLWGRALWVCAMGQLWGRALWGGTGLWDRTMGQLWSRALWISAMGQLWGRAAMEQDAMGWHYGVGRYGAAMGQGAMGQCYGAAMGQCYGAVMGAGSYGSVLWGRVLWGRALWGGAVVQGSYGAGRYGVVRGSVHCRWTRITSISYGAGRCGAGCSEVALWGSYGSVLWGSYGAAQQCEASCVAGG